MAEKIKLGLFYQNYENWAGGTYYVQNLLLALCNLPADLQPEVHILSDKRADFEEIKQLSNYPDLKYQNTVITLPLWKRAVNKLFRPFIKRNFFELRPVLDVVFPLQGAKFMYYTELSKHRVFWIPDFQEEHLPHFFNERELADRRDIRAWICERMPFLVLSSEAAKVDFQQFYGQKAICKVFVLPFAVTHNQVYKNLNINHLRDKFKLPEAYFFAPNQFWQHKNQQLILDALLLLKKENIQAHVAFSGKEYDFRNPDYTQNLKKFVQENGLESYCSFLGFIDRNEQLQLLQHSRAVLQPSLFEGWSTVVEDAKSANQYVLASDLAVHKEQLTQNVAFIDPHDTQGLANLLQKYINEKPTIEVVDYQQNISAFAQNFIQILTQITTK
jgi:glycosyltransferase involved in cell wall biosynthesis